MNIFTFTAICFLLFVSLTTGSNAIETTTNFQKPSGNNSEYAEADERSAMARLMTYIQELPVAKGKVAPLVNDGTGKPKVYVNTTLVIFSVLRVDDAVQTVTTGGYVVLLWQDKALAWNRSKYGGLESVEVPVDFIWTPQVFVINSIDYLNLLDREGLLVIVNSEGWVMARTTLVITSICEMDMTYYPFDQQTCAVVLSSYSKFVSWVFNVIDGTKYVAGGNYAGTEWEMLGFKSVLVHIPDFDESGPQVSIEMRRKTTFYVVCLVLPMVLTSYMNTLVFLLPLQSGEKVSFLISIFVSTSVFVSYFMGVMPRGLDSVPNTMKLFVGVIVESFIVLLATIGVLIRFHRQLTNEGHECSRVDSEELHSFTEKSVERGKILNEADDTGRSVCCSRGSRVHIAPLAEAQEQKNSLDAAKVKLSRSRSTKPRSVPTAEQLDSVFFVVSFIGNTIFLVILFYQTMH